MAHDPVKNPKHYQKHPSGIECIDIVEHKGNKIEGLQKVIYYLEREIQKEETP